MRKTCRDCGHVSQEKREHVYTVDPAVCSHEATDRRGSSRSTSRTFCRMCGIFVDEVPQEFHRERKAVRLGEVARSDRDGSITADDATADLDPEAVLQLLGSFQDRVQQAIALEEPTALHAWLNEAITSVMDPSPLSPSWQFAPTAMVARGRSPGRNKGKGKGVQQRDPTTAEPEFYRYRIPLGPITS